MNFQQFVFELAKAYPAIPMTLTDGGTKLEIPGFCKSGNITLDSTVKINDLFIAEARYGQIYPIDSVGAIVEIAWEWWQSSKDRHSGWKNPPIEWAEHFVSHGWLKIVSESTKTYKEIGK